MNAESISIPVFAQCAYNSRNFAVHSYKAKQLDEMSAKVSKKLTKYVFVIFVCCLD